MARLSLYLLGSFQALLDGEPVTGFESDKVRALLAFLAVEADRAHRRQSLAGLLWSAWPEAGARRNLSRALANLRSAIGDRAASPPYLLITRDTIQWDGTSDSWTDVHALRTWTDASAHLQRAVDLYRGSFLEGFSLRDSAAFEDWVVLTRERLQRRASGALHRLVEDCEDRGEYEHACGYARRRVELEPWREDVHCQIMRLLALSGQRMAALNQYETCCRALRAELDVQPSSETTRLYEQIRNGELAPPPVVGTTLSQPLAPLPSADQAAGREPVPLASTPLRVGPSLSGAAERVPSPPERRLVTALLAEVSGFTTLLEQVGSETWAQIVDRVHQVLRAQIESLGGHIIQRWDEGLVAVFGETTAHEDDPERAVLASLAALEAFSAHLGEWAALADRPQGEMSGRCLGLQLCIGVNTGEAIALGPTRDTTTGQAMVLLRRMQPALEPGAVLASEQTYQLVRSQFAWVPSGQIAVADLDRPLTLYRPLSHRWRTSKGRDLAGWSSPLVGRRSEVDALQGAIERLRTGVGGVVTLLGEAGIGKSRLVAELRRGSSKPDARSGSTGGAVQQTRSSLAVPENGAGAIGPAAGTLLWIEGRCTSYASSVVYQLWVDVLWGLLCFSPGSPGAAACAALRDRVETLCPDCIDDVYPFLARMMSLPLGADHESRLRDLEAEGLQIFTFRAVEALLEGIARRHPTIVVCEDLHWADPTSLALLERLLAMIDRVPLLLICVLRPQRDKPCWRIVELGARLYAHRHTHLHLYPLPADDERALTDNLLRAELSIEAGRGEGTPPESLCDMIARRAEGNPFFTEEIVRSLVDSQAIAYDEATNTWRLGRDPDQFAIPATLHEILWARIDHLPDDARDVLRLASVVGRVFAYPLLTQIAGDLWGLGERDLEAHLVALQRAQMVREQTRVPERTYAFAHHLTREAAYHSLLERDRRLYHRCVADTLVALDREDLEGWLGLLAYHWEHAGEAAKAILYLRRAGQHAAAHYANAEAADHLSRALDLLPQSELAERYAVLLDREDTYDAQANRAAQRQDLADLESLAHALGDREAQSEVAWRKARYAVMIADHQAAIAAARIAARLGEATRNAGCEARGHLYWGWALFREGDYQAAGQHLRRALALTASPALRRVQAMSLRILGLVSTIQGDWAGARTYHERALRLFRQTGDRRGEGKVLQNLGEVYEAQGDYLGARATYEQALGILRETSARVEEGWTLNHLGSACGSLDDYQGTISYCEQALRVFRQTGARFAEADALMRLGAGRAWLGDYSRAEPSYKQARSIYREAGSRWSECTPLLHLGQVCLAQGRFSAANERFADALSIACDADNRFVEGFALIGLCSTATKQGEHITAREHGEQALSLFREAEWQGLQWIALSLLSLLSLRLGDRDDALAYGREAVQDQPDPSDRGLWRYWFSPLLPAYALAGLGYALVTLGQLDDADDIYHRTLDRASRLRAPLAMEPLTGLGHIALAHGDPLAAMSFVERVLPELEAHHASDELLDPFQVHLTCYRVLRANADPRADDELTTAHALLQERVAGIADGKLRRSFAENIPSHAAIAAHFARRQASLR
jgi:predicted ATPase/class 3 adenylate cyclase